MSAIHEPVRRKLPAIIHQPVTPAPRLGYLAGFDCDIPITKPAQCRYYVGEYMEKIAAQLTGLPELKTNGDWCPDFIRGKEALEVKAIGNSRRLIIYEHRLAADEASGYDVSYFLWIHTAPATQATSVAALHSLLRANLRTLIVAPVGRIRELCAKAKPRKLNYRTPGHNKGALPMTGWQIGIDTLRTGQAEIVWTDGVSLTAYNLGDWHAR